MSKLSGANFFYETASCSYFFQVFIFLENEDITRLMAIEMATTKKGKVEKMCFNLGWVSPVWQSASPTYRASSNLVGEGNYDEIHSKPAALHVHHDSLSLTYLLPRISTSQDGNRGHT